MSEEPKDTVLKDIQPLEVIIEDLPKNKSNTCTIRSDKIEIQYENIGTINYRCDIY